jgi:hypothetical protein
LRRADSARFGCGHHYPLQRSSGDVENEQKRQHLKHLKWQLVTSGLVFWGGVIWMFFGLVEVGRNDGDGRTELIPQVVICGIAFLWYLIIRVRFWMLNE